jgi:hypothetical protein
MSRKNVAGRPSPKRACTHDVWIQADLNKGIDRFLKFVLTHIPEQISKSRPTVEFILSPGIRLVKCCEELFECQDHQLYKFILRFRMINRFATKKHSG